MTNKKTSAFRAWLNAQPRKALTYKKSTGKGWRTEDFVRECWRRGLEVRIPTVNRWLQGSQPRTMAMNIVREKFPTVTF